MNLPSPAAWAWIPIVLAAAAFQTVRNAAQRSLVAELGTLSATLVRFLYGLPFAALWLLVVLQFLPAGSRALSIGAVNWSYWLWLTLGAVAQILATAFLLLAMKERNFVIGVALAKTEVLQAAVLSAVLLLEFPDAWGAAAMVAATLGVVLISMPAGGIGGIGGVGGLGKAFTAANWQGKAALAGLASGACFAMASVGYRGAALTQPGVSPWLIGASGVLLAQLLQTILLGGWIAAREPGKLAKIARAWRISSVAGAMGALASIGWFTAFALKPAAEVKTLGLIEVIFSYAVSHKLFDEKLSGAERLGLILVTVGLVVICAQL
jgi:drug/metabolite transporter (DMT)-like permease